MRLRTPRVHIFVTVSSMVGPWLKSATKEHEAFLSFRRSVYTYCKLVREYSAKISRLVQTRSQVHLRVLSYRPFYVFDYLVFNIADGAYCEALEVEYCTVHTGYYDGYCCSIRMSVKL